MLAYCVKDGQQHDAEQFLDFYLDALDEELVQLHAYIGTHKLVSVPSVEELDSEEGEDQSTEAQTEVGKRDYTVCQFFFLSDMSLTLLTYAWMRTGKFSGVTHLAPNRRKIPFNHTRAQSARHYHHPKLANTPTQHPGRFLLPLLRGYCPGD